MKNYLTSVKAGWALGLSALVVSASAQVRTPPSVISRDLAEQPEVLTGFATVPAAQLLCEIDDPHSGRRWLLLRNEDHSGGPGRLVLATLRQAIAGVRPDLQLGKNHPVVVPVIHAGDRLEVEEHTTVADARLEAVALGPAMAGSTFAVRLKFGGKVVRAIALAHGKAIFAPETTTSGGQR